MALTTVSHPAPGVIDTPVTVPASWAPAIPPAFAVPVAAGALWDASAYRPEIGTQVEGPRYFAVISPGSIQFRKIDLAKAQRRAEKVYKLRQLRVRMLVGWHYSVEMLSEAKRVADLFGIDPASVPCPLGDPLARPASKAKITEWSAPSRVNMVRRYATLDYGPMFADGLPALVTYTLPEEWEELAPSGREFKRLLSNFRKRFEAAWSRRLRCLWKLEFQDRGAPHMHMLMVPPHGQVDGLLWRDWFAREWANVLDVAGETRRKVIAVHRHRKASQDYAEGLRATDPKRISVYFAKHSGVVSKEYQHVVPELWQGEGNGPGRFWGYWGLNRADTGVAITEDEVNELARLVRRWARSERGTRRVRTWRTDVATGEVRARTSRRRVRPLPRTCGFLVVNDGPAVALMLARYLQRRPQREPRQAWELRFPNLARLARE